MCSVSVAVRGLSLAAVSQGSSSLGWAGFSLRRLLLPQRTGARAHLAACGLQGAVSAVVAHGLSCPEACVSSPTGGGTRVPCIGRRILIHCAAREVPEPRFLSTPFNYLHHYLSRMYYTKTELEDLTKMDGTQRGDQRAIVC